MATGVLSVPLAPLIRAVPCGSEMTDGFKVSTLGVRADTGVVMSSVVAVVHECEVGWVVVEGVSVDMVDDLPLGDGAEMELPYLSVERFNHPGNVAPTRGVVPLVVGLGRVRVTTEPDPVELDFINPDCPRFGADVLGLAVSPPQVVVGLTHASGDLAAPAAAMNSAG